jgi:translation elongation factor EF-4
VRACEGAVLAVDASQGLQAQTLAVCNLARSAGLDIIPILTKCDLAGEQSARVIEQMFSAFNIDPDTGTGYSEHCFLLPKFALLYVHAIICSF